MPVDAVERSSSAAGRASGPAPDLSVIIVTWNVRALTLACIDAVFRTATESSVEVIVVDNASTDGTVEGVRQAYPGVRVLANTENVGFPAANNQALEVARGRHVLFLNPDTVVGPDTLDRCVAELDREPDIGVVGCRLEYPDGTVQYEGARNPYRLGDLLFEIGYLHMLFPRSQLFGRHLMGYWDHKDSRDVEALCGAFMMARRGVATGVDGLPEDAFMYHEDLSFCLRVRKAGWRIHYLGEVHTTHHGNQSGRQSRSRWASLDGEWKIRLIREAQGPAAAAVGRAAIVVRSLVRLVVGGVGRLLPGSGRLRRRHPGVFDLRTHALQLLWAFAPGRVRRRVVQRGHA